APATAPRVAAVPSGFRLPGPTWPCRRTATLDRHFGLCPPGPVGPLAGGEDPQPPAATRISSVSRLAGRSGLAVPPRPTTGSDVAKAPARMARRHPPGMTRRSFLGRAAAAAGAASAFSLAP